jgi:hypothetical protein
MQASASAASRAHRKVPASCRANISFKSQCADRHLRAGRAANVSSLYLAIPGRLPCTPRPHREHAIMHDAPVQHSTCDHGTQMATDLRRTCTRRALVQSIRLSPNCRRADGNPVEFGRTNRIESALAGPPTRRDVSSGLTVPVPTLRARRADPAAAEPVSLR